MRRRRHTEEHETTNAGWCRTPTSLPCCSPFFVVMYSISSINEGKYKVISQALLGVFNDPERSMKPIPIGEERPLSVRPAEPLVKDSEQTDAGLGATSIDPLKTISDDVRDAFGDLIKSDQMTVRGNELWIEIELNSSLLFGSGDAMPSDKAFAIIEKVAGILKPFANPVHVEGFTDNLPIRTAQYPTNWELSSARAASIVRLLAMEGQPGTHGLGRLWRVPAGCQQRHCRRPCAQSPRGAGDFAQPRSAPQPDWLGQCQCHAGCCIAPGWHTKCTGNASNGGGAVIRQFPDAAK